MTGLGLLDYNIRLMRTIGLWPLDRPSRPLLVVNYVYTTLLVVSLVVVSVCQIIEIFVSPNITSMASAVDLATLTASALFKMVYLIYYRQHFQELVDKINSTFVKTDFFCGQFDINDWIKNSKKIIRDIDSLLRSMVIVDFGHAVISLSFAMLQTITSNTLFEWFQMCIFIGVCILHQFLNNYFGEILSQQQLSVSDAVYEIPWVEGSDLQKMAVYMTLNQANHPTRLSGWRMYHLKLSTFVEFMKLLASYFLVLQSLHADESRKER
ncbi:uncharacterized protein LOC128994966 [Macrosteles quadrilineatus]|uniref:uncharacterized protein LOC128994966 n=1 Tax=Macrosteles quadrilineatus TaxID=74068 RepID=UPI0023E18AAE|nr:uncharacterized protein LOC128994966 [Macrosteles quadrilineatus]